MKHSKHDTSNNPALDKRQGLDDRELKENAADNARARERARADWEHAASHRKDAPQGPETGKADKAGKPAGGKGDMRPGVGQRDLHDPAAAPPTRRRP